MGQLTQTWFDTYGSTLLFRNNLHRPDILTRDPAVINAIIRGPPFERGSTGQAFTKAMGLRYSLTALKGDHHKRIKRAMMPAFGPLAIAAMWPDILDKCQLLKDKVLRECVNGQTTIPANQYMAMLSIEVIDKCGFGRDSDIITLGKESDMALILKKVLPMGRTESWKDLIKGNRWIPFGRVSKDSALILS